MGRLTVNSADLCTKSSLRITYISSLAGRPFRSRWVVVPVKEGTASLGAVWIGTVEVSEEATVAVEGQRRKRNDERRKHTTKEGEEEGTHALYLVDTVLAVAFMSIIVADKDLRVRRGGAVVRSWSRRTKATFRPAICEPEGGQDKPAAWTTQSRATIEWSKKGEGKAVELLYTHLIVGARGEMREALVLRRANCPAVRITLLFRYWLLRLMK